MSRRYGGSPAGTVISVIADLAALILILWIAFYLFDANTANNVVSWIHDAANWLSGWSHNLFSIDSDNWRTVVNYGLPALVYLFIGHAVAGRTNRA
ncbi:hypothetical protein [Streptomyces pseudovenezuelae]|uniref:Uncharacterized protein n=1 Tax=Streptomyces pseudovenezuelae TaxID=67350 RepID=A0ABT6L9A7_9ACTN|nr:hypothetical protein [Streptomyces pseudovenezuelae]MDH6212903.1 hypothetical protein [Streptomyces pseudovenezuelae]